ARATLMIGWLAIRQGDLRGAEAEFVAVIGRLGEASRPEELAQAHKLLAYILVGRDENDEAHDHQARALAQFRVAGDRLGEAEVLADMGWYAAWSGRPDEGSRLAEEAAAITRTPPVVEALMGAAFFSGDLRRAIALALENVTLTAGQDDTHAMVRALGFAAFAMLLAEDARAGAEYQRQAL